MPIFDELLTSHFTITTSLAARLDFHAFVPYVDIVRCHLRGILGSFQRAIFIKSVIGDNLLATGAFNPLLLANLTVLRPFADHKWLGACVALDLSFKRLLLRAFEHGLFNEGHHFVF